MSDYSTLDRSPHGGKPYHLYAFAGDAGAYYYTDNETIITFEGNDYLPVQITRDLIQQSSVLEDAVTVNVSISLRSQLFEDYGGAVTPETLEVTIKRFQRDATDGSYKNILVGKCVDHSVSKLLYVLSFQSKLQTEVTADVALVVFANRCNNLFGDVRCKFDVAAQTITGTITAHDDTSITVAEALTADKYIGGVLTVGTQRRLIMGNDAHTITFAYPFLVTGSFDACTIAPGCDLSFTQCKAYGNTNNYTGFAAIPEDNPFAADLNEIIANFTNLKTQTDTTKWKMLPFGLGSTF